MPGFDPGPPVRIVDPSPDGPTPGVPVDGPLDAGDRRAPTDPDVH
jgi:hypothetical protein